MNITISLPEEIIEETKEKSKKIGSTFSGFVRTALESKLYSK